jgi:hypothetical protein
MEQARAIDQYATQYIPHLLREINNRVVRCKASLALAAQSGNVACEGAFGGIYNWEYA